MVSGYSTTSPYRERDKIVLLEDKDKVWRDSSSSSAPTSPLSTSTDDLNYTFITGI
jgi:hypothetical protein